MRYHELYYRYERRIADMKAENARLRAALEAVEWFTKFDITYCPWCVRIKEHGHASDCARQIALGLATSGADSAA